MQGRSDNYERLEAAVGLYSDALMRVAFNALGTRFDAEDAVQETFLRYLRYAPVFNGGDHEKAWLIRVCLNVCRDFAKERRKRDCLSLEDFEDLVPSHDETDREVMESVAALPEKFRTVINLYYVENYSTNEIAELVGIKAATVRKRLEYGRKLLKMEMKPDETR